MPEKLKLWQSAVGLHKGRRVVVMAGEGVVVAGLQEMVCTALRARVCARVPIHASAQAMAAGGGPHEAGWIRRTQLLHGGTLSARTMYMPRASGDLSVV